MLEYIQSNSYIFIIIISVIITAFAYYMEQPNNIDQYSKTEPFNYIRYVSILLISMLVLYGVMYMYNNNELMGKVNQFGSSL